MTVVGREANRASGDDPLRSQLGDGLGGVANLMQHIIGVLPDSGCSVRRDQEIQIQ